MGYGSCSIRLGFKEERPGRYIESPERKRDRERESEKAQKREKERKKHARKREKKKGNCPPERIERKKKERKELEKYISGNRKCGKKIRRERKCFLERRRVDDTPAKNTGETPAKHRRNTGEKHRRKTPADFFFFHRRDAD